jgi:hypothetical protein
MENKEAEKSNIILIIMPYDRKYGLCGFMHYHLREMIITCGIRASLHVEAVESRDPMDGNFRTTWWNRTTSVIPIPGEAGPHHRHA